MRMPPQRLIYLNIQSPAGGTVWEGSGALLEGWATGSGLLSSLSASCLWIRCDFSATALVLWLRALCHVPCHDGPSDILSLTTKKVAGTQEFRLGNLALLFLLFRVNSKQTLVPLPHLQSSASKHLTLRGSGGDHEHAGVSLSAGHF